MRKIMAICCLLVAAGASGQGNETLGKKIDELTYAWDLEATNLDEYNGMLKFCTNRPYRMEIIQLLQDIHHYDSVLYDRLIKAARFSHDKELKKTIEDIELFEVEYSMTEFVKFLFDECQAIQKIENDKKNLEGTMGAESYDGKKYVIETELGKYIHHITKRMDVIRKHVHHLHVE